MKPFSPRRLAWSAAIAAIVLAPAVLALPYAASSRLTGERIAESIEQWSGLQVSLNNPPEIGIWPDLQADLTGVTLKSPDGGLTIEAERIEIELSALSVLRGDIDFTKARFIAPTVTLGRSALPFRQGRIAKAIATARSVVAANPAAPDRKRLPADDFGIVEFTNGRLVSETGAEIATGLHGKVSWEELDGPAKISANGRLRDEDFRLELSSAGPLLLLGGAATPLTLNFESAPVRLSFNGVAGLGDNPYAAGRATLAAASAEALSSWTGASSLLAHTVGTFSIEGQTQIDSQRLRVEDARVVLGERTAHGAFDLLLTGQRPKVSGTLAFDTLDMGVFSPALFPFGPGTDTGATPRVSYVDMDLRLSAREATIGTVTLNELAATARIEDGYAAFDISDASAFGGDIQAGFRFSRAESGRQIDMRVLATEVSGEAFGNATGLASFTPRGRSDVSLIVKGRGDDWRSFLSHASGSFSASIGPGTLPRIDVDGFAAQVRAAAPFMIHDAAKGSSGVDGIEIKAVMEDGTIRFERLEIRSPAQRITLNGSLPLDGRDAALSGKIEAPPQLAGGTGGPSSTAAFRIEGPWKAATVVPEVPAAE